MTGTSAPSLSPATIATSIQTAWTAHLERQRRTPAPHPYVYASAYRTCERRMVLELTQPDQQPPFPAEVLAKFRRGEDRERELLIDLSRVGREAEPPFTVVAQQERFELRDHRSRVAIVGKVDARLQLAGGPMAPVEVKAWSPFLVDRIETFDDLFRSPWTRSGAYQLLTYLYGAGVPFGFLLLDRSGLPLLVPVELDRHLDALEDFLSRAERVLDHVAAGTLPDYLDDPTECQRCPFYGAICNPPLRAAGAAVLERSRARGAARPARAARGGGDRVRPDRQGRQEETARHRARDRRPVRDPRDLGHSGARGAAGPLEEAVHGDRSEGTLHAARDAPHVKGRRRGPRLPRSRPPVVGDTLWRIDRPGRWTAWLICEL